MIRTRRPRRGGISWIVYYRRPDGRKALATFHDRDEAEAFDRIANARWPLAPLLDAAGYRDADTFAAALRLAPGELAGEQQWGLSDTQADRLAIRAGLHPAYVWGWAWITTALPTAEEPAA